jgi:diadenosine tetraphosphate (Ap4A) HIT family hydrolase
MGNCGTKKERCVFCDIANTNKERILFENENVILFEDISPIAYVHLQCIPKRHIVNINELTIHELGLLNEMKQIAMEYIISHYYDINENDIIFGFHVPPFYSVKHLHMHCVVPPFKNNCLKCLKVDCIMRSYDKVIQQLQY